MRDSKDIAFLAQEAIEEKKGRNLVIMEIKDLSLIADYFVICTGNSPLQLEAITTSVEEKFDKEGIKLLGKEGIYESGWILLDYGYIIVHIFSQEKRDFYGLERLWGDATIIFREKTYDLP